MTETTAAAALSGLKPLTNLQYDNSRERALSRVGNRIGERPTRKQFQRELGALWTILDVIALVVFIPALVVSSVHIIAHMGAQANFSYPVTSLTEAGTVISRDTYVWTHQWFTIPMAEGAMILFMVMFGMTRGWRRWVYLLMAATALIFVAIANWQSNIGVLESLLAPIFTIGIGLKLELLIVQMIKRRNEVDKLYLEALGIWEAASKDATNHPDYVPLLRQEIWAELVKKNKDYADAPRGFKYAAVEREMARERWAYESSDAIETFQPVEEVKADVKPVREVKAQQLGIPFGEAGDQTPDGPASTTVMLSANGHTAIAAEN